MQNYKQNLEWMLQATSGIQFLHARGIIHRDVKPANMLLSNNRNLLKLSDMSLSIWTGENQYENTFDGRGTPGFRAWEIENGEDYTSAVDVFGLGRSLWNMLHRQHPTDRGLAASFCISRDLTEQAPYIKECLRRASENSGDPTFKDLCTQYLQSPEEREYYDLLKEKLRENDVNYCRFLGDSERLPITDVYSVLKETFEDPTINYLSQIKTVHPVYKESDLRRLLGSSGVKIANVGEDRCVSFPPSLVTLTW